MPILQNIVVIRIHRIRKKCIRSMIYYGHPGYGAVLKFFIKCC